MISSLTDSELKLERCKAIAHYVNEITKEDKTQFSVSKFAHERAGIFEMFDEFKDGSHLITQEWVHYMRGDNPLDIQAGNEIYITTSQHSIKMHCSSKNILKKIQMFEVLNYFISLPRTDTCIYRDVFIIGDGNVYCLPFTHVTVTPRVFL